MPDPDPASPVAVRYLRVGALLLVGAWSGLWGYRAFSLWESWRLCAQVMGPWVPCGPEWGAWDGPLALAAIPWGLLITQRVLFRATAG